MAVTKFKSRVVGYKDIPAALLDPHPDNVRSHPKSQAKGMLSLLDTMGFAGVILVREKAGDRYEVLDGHLRAGLLPDETLPCAILDLNAKEAKLFITTYDAIGTQAQIDVGKVVELVKTLTKSQQSTADIVLNLSKIERLTQAEDTFKSTAFAAGKLKQELEGDSGVEIFEERKNFWCYVEFTGEGAIDMESSVLAVLGTGRSRQLDPEKVLEAAALYQKKNAK